MLVKNVINNNSVEYIALMETLCVVTAWIQKYEFS